MLSRHRLPAIQRPFRRHGYPLIARVTRGHRLADHRGTGRTRSTCGKNTRTRRPATGAALARLQAAPHNRTATGRSSGTATVSHNEHEIQKPPLRLGVLISGSGTNLQALIDAIENQQLPGVEIALVVSNNPDAHGLQRALKHKIPAIYLPWRQAIVGYREPGQHTSRALSEAKR